MDTSSTHKYKVIEVYTISEKDICYLEIDSVRTDSQLFHFYNYYQPYRNQFPFIDLGFEGSPMLDLGSTLSGSKRLEIGVPALEQYFYNDSIFIRHTPRPFTRLNYSQGNQELVAIEVQHYQQISQRLTFGIDYRRLKNNNIYYANLLNSDRVRFANLFNSKAYLGYQSFDRKYEILFSYLWNKNTNIETGGIEDPGLFTTLTGRNKLENNDVFLSSARNENAVNSFKLVQFYRPGGGKLDSSKANDLSRFHNQFMLKTKFSSQRLTYVDDDPDSSYYGIKLEFLVDSIYNRKVSNEFGYLFTIRQTQVFASLEHVYDRIFMNTGSQNFQNVYLKLTGSQKFGPISANAQAGNSIAGYNLGDYFLDVDVSAKLKKLRLEGRYLSQLAEPDYITQNFESTIISWSSNLNKTYYNDVYSKLSYEDSTHAISLSGRVLSMLNYVYYDSFIAPKQFTDAVNLTQLNLTYNLKWRPLSIRSTLLYQNSSNQSVLPRPVWSANAAIFTEFKLFKENLKTQVGLESWWFSDFESPVYLPYTRQWHVNGKTFSSYPPVQLFVNAQVRTFSFGITLFNVQAGFMGADYFSSPGYPMMPRTLRLNLRWDLNN